ncbi:MAG: ATP-binding protein [Bacteroidetes bacterium]|nr:MAG: ATP-binding protein [Bacteroidota bacterium]
MMHYIEELILQGEHQTQDFKFRVDDARKIAKTLVAFANTDGGRLLIGVKDNGRIAGVRSDEEYYVIEAAAELYTEPNVSFTAIAHDVSGKQVLEVIVEPSDERPHFAIDKDGKKWAYFRRADQNHPANGVLLEFWRMRDETSRTTVLEKYGDVHRKLYELIYAGERVSISKLIKAANISPEKARHILATFLHWELIDYNIDQNGIYFTDLEEIT